MRKSKREIKDKTVIADLLNSCHVGRLGTNGRDGYPIIKPVNFAYQDGIIYFHSAMEGEKIEDITRDNRVCFEVDLPVAYVAAIKQPCEATYLYRSVIIKGKASFVEETEEKMRAIILLMKKYQPQSCFDEIPDDKLKITAVVRIDIEEMVGKEHMKQGAIYEQNR